MCEKGGNKVTISNIYRERTWKGGTRGDKIKNPFLKSETKTKGTLELIHSYALEEIWIKNGPPKENNKKCHVAMFLYYFTFIEGAKGYLTFIKATLNIYFILKSIMRMKFDVLFSPKIRK